MANKKKEMNFDPHFFEMMADWAQGLGISVERVIENLILGRFARDEAEREVWGSSGAKLLPEFSIMGDKELSGLELFRFLKDWFIREEEAKRQRPLTDYTQRGKEEAQLTPKQREALEYARERLGKIKGGWGE